MKMNMLLGIVIVFLSFPLVAWSTPHNHSEMKNGTLYASFHDAKVDAVARSLAKTTGISFRVMPDIQGRINADIQGMPTEQAIATIFHGFNTAITYATAGKRDIRFVDLLRAGSASLTQAKIFTPEGTQISLWKTTALPLHSMVMPQQERRKSPFFAKNFKQKPMLAQVKQSMKSNPGLALQGSLQRQRVLQQQMQAGGSNVPLLKMELQKINRVVAAERHHVAMRYLRSGNI